LCRWRCDEWRRRVRPVVSRWYAAKKVNHHGGTIRKQSPFQQVTGKLLSLVIRLMINDSIAAHTLSGIRWNDGEGVLQTNEEVRAAQVQQRGDDLHSDGDKETDHEHDQHKGDEGIKAL